MKSKSSTASLLLLVTTAIWGWTFIIVKWSVASIDPYFFIFCRFLLALLLLGSLFFSRIKENWRACFKPGLFLGVLLGLAFITQTLGLKYTTASTSGFITGLNVIFVTVIAAVVNRRLPRKLVLLGIVSATIGLLLITFKGSLSFAKGDLLTLACALLCAFHVVYTERLAADLPASVLTIVQFATITIFSGIAACLFGKVSLHSFDFSLGQSLAILYCGILATAMAFLFQTKAQQKLPTFRTAVILAFEPLFAGIFAIGLRFDPFHWQVVGGGLLIIGGMILASWDSKSGPVVAAPEKVPPYAGQRKNSPEPRL